MISKLVGNLLLIIAAFVASAIVLVLSFYNLCRWFLE